MSSEVWKEVQLSTLELSITTRNSQLDLTVSVLLKLKKKKKKLEKHLVSGKSDQGYLLFY